MNFSQRTNWATASNPLAQALEKLRAKGTEILDLTVSNPTRCGFQYLSTEILTALNRPENLSYDPDPHGLLRAREAVCGYYAEKGIRLSPEQVFLTASTSEAYSFVLRLLCNPGDSIFAPSPGYPLLGYLAELNDLKVERYRNEAPSPYPLPQGEREKKAVLVVNPNNPTGRYARREDFQRNIPVIADEVFFDFDLLNAPRSTLNALSFASSNSVLTFTLSGISKILGLPQMKLSWIVVTGPEKIRREAIGRLEIISDTFLSASTPVQNALPAWMKQMPEIRREILERVRGNYSTLKQWVSGRRDARLMEAEGGWYAVLEFPNESSDEALALRLLESRHVLAHPGYLFDFEEGTHLVLSLLPQPEIFQDALKRL